jgi:NAD(P)-dependent dehydrogenase (short-subunit alcohol dehydrogenase family)
MSLRWLQRGWNMFGTYRTSSLAVEALQSRGAELARCDLASPSSIRESCVTLRNRCPAWDVLVLAPGSQEPIGNFMECAFDEWEQSVIINFSSQMRIVHELLPSRRLDRAHGPIVMFFAGGGTNNATVGSSAYTISKIALIKMCELLDAEIPDTRFVIMGPGWVRTKIHDATLKAGVRAGANYNRTAEKLAGDEMTPIDHVLDFCDWVETQPRRLVSGRNFSIVFDSWGSEELANLLAGQPDVYKLRRHGNDLLVRSTMGRK